MKQVRRGNYMLITVLYVCTYSNGLTVITGNWWNQTLNSQQGTWTIENFKISLQMVRIDNSARLITGCQD